MMRMPARHMGVRPHFAHRTPHPCHPLYRGAVCGWSIKKKEVHMEYRVLPGFLRRREQRLAGLITLPQVLAGLGSLLPVYVAAQAGWLSFLLMLVLAGVAVY